MNLINSSTMTYKIWTTVQWKLVGFQLTKKQCDHSLGFNNILQTHHVKYRETPMLNSCSEYKVPSQEKVKENLAPVLQK
jgi:hypothetical protein